MNKPRNVYKRLRKKKIILPLGTILFRFIFWLYSSPLYTIILILQNDIILKQLNVLLAHYVFSYS